MDLTEKKIKKVFKHFNNNLLELDNINNKYNRNKLINIGKENDLKIKCDEENNPCNIIDDNYIRIYVRKTEDDNINGAFKYFIMNIGLNKF